MNDSSSSDIELLAPAGSFETARAAFAAGADAVYLGLDAFSARADAVNFTPEQLRDLLALARDPVMDDTRGVVPHAKKVYVTFNTLLDDAQRPQAAEKLALLEELRPDGVIVQDLGVARLVRRHFPSLELHASTQLVAHNLEGVLALRDLGFTRVVLARELSLDDIRSICRRCGCEIEVFVHGALCYSLSGLCLFSALEKNRSGNRGKCAYCCRLSYTDASGARALPFSMRDLRLDDHLDRLRDAGVASLKIEGRMKSPLYVSTVTAHYRELLDGRPRTTTRADLETVFSRRTTTLYADGYTTAAPVIDPSSLGHLGTPIGTVKRLTKDRDGRTWLRLHTSRALERHDGLQFLSEGNKPIGFGIADMHTALSRSTVFSVPANSDVEILVPDSLFSQPPSSNPQPSSLKHQTSNLKPQTPIRPGDMVFCSASNAVKRRFPVPPFRPADVVAGTPVDVTLTLAPDGISASAIYQNQTISTSLPLTLSTSQHPERTEEAVRKALARMGGTDWSLGALTLVDPDHLFAPASMLNDLRRQLVERLDAARLEARQAKISSALDDLGARTSRSVEHTSPVGRTLKIRLDQALPDDVCDYDELVVAIGHRSGRDVESSLAELARTLRARAEESGDPVPSFRLALPVFTLEGAYNQLRATVKHMVKAGISAWEAADLAGLRLLDQLGLADVTADWTLYALNQSALAQLAELGAIRCVTSPENSAENLQTLANLPVPNPSIEFLRRQTTPLFISLTRPATDAPSLLTGLKGDTFTSYLLDGLWITARPEPRRFPLPGNAAALRTDLSWDAPDTFEDHT